jgi:hypothetical protein
MTAQAHCGVAIASSSSFIFFSSSSSAPDLSRPRHLQASHHQAIQAGEQREHEPHCPTAMLAARAPQADAAYLRCLVVVVGRSPAPFLPVPETPVVCPPRSGHRGALVEMI